MPERSSLACRAVEVRLYDQAKWRWGGDWSSGTQGGSVAVKCIRSMLNTPSAAHQNDETLLVIDSPLLAAHFTREIDRLWKGAELGITERLARKQERQRQRCGSVALGS